MSILIVVFFFGGWYSFFYLIFIPGWINMILKVCIIISLFILVRATLPRYRYDQLMNIGWKVLLPLSLVHLLFYSIFFFILF
jgi:NADH-quinone oxidoreductase subunit H